MSLAERSVGRSPLSDQEELANIGGFTPEREARSEDDKRLVEESENETASTSYVLYRPSPVLLRAIHTVLSCLGAPLAPILMVLQQPLCQVTQEVDCPRSSSPIFLRRPNGGRI
jgi:hypothetical protein